MASSSSSSSSSSTSIISSTKKGFLYKQSKHSGTWQKRFCSINGSFLTIYKSQQQDASTLIAMVDLAQVIQVYVAECTPLESNLPGTDTKGFYIILQIQSKHLSHQTLPGPPPPQPPNSNNDENLANPTATSGQQTFQLFKLRTPNYADAAYWVALISFVRDKANGFVRKIPRKPRSFSRPKSFSATKLSSISEEPEYDPYRSLNSSFSSYLADGLGGGNASRNDSLEEDENEEDNQVTSQLLADVMNELGEGIEEDEEGSCGDLSLDDLAPLNLSSTSKEDLKEVIEAFEDLFPQPLSTVPFPVDSVATATPSMSNSHSATEPPPISESTTLEVMKVVIDSLEEIAAHTADVKVDILLSPTSSASSNDVLHEPQASNQQAVPSIVTTVDNHHPSKETEVGKENKAVSVGPTNKASSSTSTFSSLWIRLVIMVICIVIAISAAWVTSKARRQLEAPVISPDAMLSRQQMSNQEARIQPIIELAGQETFDLIVLREEDVNLVSGKEEVGDKSEIEAQIASHDAMPLAEEAIEYEAEDDGTVVQSDAVIDTSTISSLEGNEQLQGTGTRIEEPLITESIIDTDTEGAVALDEESDQSKTDELEESTATFHLHHEDDSSDNVLDIDAGENAQSERRRGVVSTKLSSFKRLLFWPFDFIANILKLIFRKR
eukprot:gene5196-5718_t